MSEPDVVEELKHVLAEWYDTYGEPVPYDTAAIQRAIDEIMHLRNENREMRRTFGSHPLFKEARVKALEEAATACRLLGQGGNMETALACAAAIRALKDKRDE